MLQKPLKLLLRSDNIWAILPEIWIWFISTGAQEAALLVSTQVVWMQVFIHFGKHAHSNITSPPSKVFPRYPLC